MRSGIWVGRNWEATGSVEGGETRKRTVHWQQCSPKSNPHLSDPLKASCRSTQACAGDISGVGPR